NIDDFVAALRKLPNNEPVAVVTHSVGNVHKKLSHAVVVSHAWSKIRIYTRNDRTGVWDREKVEPDPRPASTAPVNVKVAGLSDPRVGPSAALSRAMVSVTALQPVAYDGIYGIMYVDYGAVVDAERGLVLVSRRTIPLNICCLTVTVGSSLALPAKLRFTHPTHNFAIIQFDPKRIGANNLHQMTFSPHALKQGDAAQVVTFNNQANPMCVSTVVSDMTEVQIDTQFPPSWRSINMETVQFESRLVGDFRFGLVGDEEGRTSSFWVPFVGSQDNTFSGGLPALAVQPALQALQRGEEPRLRLLCIEVTSVGLSIARASGLSQRRFEEVQKATTNRNTLFRIENVELLSRAHGVLQPLDIIISINGKLMLHVGDLEP
ncbi:hypothetical protein H4R19_006935, partial [Coemansia spiralis]